MPILTKAERNFLMNNFVHRDTVEHNVHIDTPSITPTERSLLSKGFLKERMDYNVRAETPPRHLLTTSEKAEEYLAKKLKARIRYQVAGHEYSGKQYIKIPEGETERIIAEEDAQSDKLYGRRSKKFEEKVKKMMKV